MKIQLSTLLKIMDNTYDVTICYASNGHRLYKGHISEIPTHLLLYYVTLLLPGVNGYYIEVHEMSSFLE